MTSKGPSPRKNNNNKRRKEKLLEVVGRHCPFAFNCSPIWLVWWAS